MGEFNAGSWRGWINGRSEWIAGEWLARYFEDLRPLATIELIEIWRWWVRQTRIFVYREYPCFENQPLDCFTTKYIWQYSHYNNYDIGDQVLNGSEQFYYYSLWLFYENRYINRAWDYYTSNFYANSYFSEYYLESGISLENCLTWQMYRKHSNSHISYIFFYVACVLYLILTFEFLRNARSSDRTRCTSFSKNLKSLEKSLNKWCA